jgi:tetratricopeptide (TPR) repeat protein
MAVSLRHLAQVALLEGDASEARTIFEESLAIYRDLGDRGGLAASLTGLGMALTALGEYSDSWTQLRRALQITAEIGLPPLILSTLVGIGDLLLHRGQTNDGHELLSLVVQHPLSNQQTRDEVNILLAPYGDPVALSDDPDQALESAVERLLHSDVLTTN